LLGNLRLGEILQFGKEKPKTWALIFRFLNEEERSKSYMSSSSSSPSPMSLRKGGSPLAFFFGAGGSFDASLTFGLG
jgi:hypothetical protein